MTISGDIPEHKEWCSLLTFSFQLTTQKDSIRGVDSWSHFKKYK
jgi:hypothetical protein